MREAVKSSHRATKTFKKRKGSRKAQNEARGEKEAAQRHE